jgi:hypothetical protein
MALNSNFVTFREVYDQLTDEVGRSSNTFIPEHLRAWFERLDQTPGVSGVIARLQSGLDFDEWFKTCTNEEGGDLLWPTDAKGRLGMKLLLFRSIAEGRHDAGMLGIDFTYAGNANLDDNGRAFIDQVFGPLARELRRKLETEVGEREEMEIIPASDRTVTINHNSSEYTAAAKALDDLEYALRTANDFVGEPEEKDQRIAEVGAVKRLLEAARVRVEPVQLLLKSWLVQYATQVKTGLIAIAAAATISALRSLIGF